MTEIRDHFRNVSAVLTAKADVAGGARHSSTTGTLREEIIQDFLRPHLPRVFDVLAGVVIDSNGARSSQQDCLIVDSRFPLIDIGSAKNTLVLAENVTATVEVKSHLGKAELVDSLKKAARIKSLVRKGSQEYSKGSALIKVPNAYPILSYIVAYNGTDLRKLIGYIKDFAYGAIDGVVHDTTQIIDGICVLSKGVILKDSLMPVVSGDTVTLPSISSPKIRVFPYKKDALFAFYRHMHSALTYLRMQNYDFDAYYEEGTLE